MTAEEFKRVFEQAYQCEDYENILEWLLRDREEYAKAYAKELIEKRLEFVKSTRGELNGIIIDELEQLLKKLEQ